MKCDEQRPSCSMCRNSKLVCGGYGKSIFFDFQSNSKGAIARFRRPLLTEKERECMSKEIISIVPPRLALWNIAQIDDECENKLASQDIQISRGPFGAFRFGQPSPSELTPSSDTPLDCSEDSNSPEDADFVQTNNYLLHAETALSPYYQAPVESSLDQTELDSIQPQLDFWNSPLTADPNRVQEVFDFDAIEMPSTQQFPMAHLAPMASQFPQFTFDALFHQSAMQSSISMVPIVDNNVPDDAVFLLKYYASTIPSLVSPYRHTKTPWHILFIPHAKNCLAALTLGEDLDHASLAAFYGTLAISAFSLSGAFQSQLWLEQAITYKQKAREYIRLMLKTAYDIPKKAKYKSILMALLTMVQGSIFSGNRDQTECYFLEAEKFIRLRGLNRNKSRKVRLLHHCYAFERIFYESTVVSGSNSKHRHHVRIAIESSGMVVSHQDSLTFHLPNCSNLVEEMSRVKGKEESENDLHLERLGVWNETLYPEIFGIPEPLVLLLSQVIRLGNEKDAVEHQDLRDPLSLGDFLSRAKSIEGMINRLLGPSQNTHPPVHDETQIERCIADRMLEALRCALSIYFYRRIYDVDPSILQQKVIQVRECLLYCNEADPNGHYSSARFIWPAFIAACEAEDPDVQTSFSNWFKNSAQKSGLLAFTNTLEDIERVWQEKRSVVGTSVTWLDLARKNQDTRDAALIDLS
jgi:arginine metabolism regulation protein II